jgi:hypothetical protein
MKTPKRHYELTAVSHDPCERVWDRPQEEVSAQRWKRKNRIRQLKATIARLTEENNHLRTLLSLRIQHEYLESQKAALEWAAKHISAHIHQAETTTEWEDSGPVTYLHCPLPTITYNRSTGLLVPTTTKQP